jgi:hypothetical protein
MKARRGNSIPLWCWIYLYLYLCGNLAHSRNAIISFHLKISHRPSVSLPSIYHHIADYAAPLIPVCLHCPRLPPFPSCCTTLSSLSNLSLSPSETNILHHGPTFTPLLNKTHGPLVHLIHIRPLPVAGHILTSNTPRLAPPHLGLCTLILLVQRPMLFVLRCPRHFLRFLRFPSHFRCLRSNVSLPLLFQFCPLFT